MNLVNYIGDHYGINLSRLIDAYVIKLVIPPPNEVGGGVYWIHLVRPSVCLQTDMVSGA